MPCASVRRSAAPLASPVKSRASALTRWPSEAAATATGVEGAVSPAPGIFPAPSLRHRAPTSGGSRRRVPAPPLPHRAPAPRPPPPRVWQTLGRPCRPLTSLLRRPPTAGSGPSVASAPGALRGAPAARSGSSGGGRILRSEPTMGGGLGRRAAPRAPSPAATLAPKVMSAALPYIRSFPRCRSSCARARWPRSARRGRWRGILPRGFPGTSAPRPGPASSPPLPSRAPPQQKPLCTAPRESAAFLQ